MVCIDAPTGTAGDGQKAAQDPRPETPVGETSDFDTLAKAADPVKPAAPATPQEADARAVPAGRDQDAQAPDAHGRSGSAKAGKIIGGPGADQTADDGPEHFATGSEVMDDILEHSQLRMLEAIKLLARRVDMLADVAKKNEDVTHKGKMLMAPQVA